MRSQPLHPAQFVIEFGAGKRIAVGQVDAAHADSIYLGFEIPGVIVLGIFGEEFGQAAPGLNRLYSIG